MALAAQLHGLATTTPTLWKIAMVTGVCQLCFYYNDLYNLTIVHSGRELLVRLLQAAGAATRPPATPDGPAFIRLAPI